MRAIAVLVTGFLLVPSLGRAGETPGSGAPPSQGPPQVVDIAGDANGLLFAQNDTRPASYDRADLLSLRIETSFVAVPVGEDGVDYRATGLRFRVRTLASPHDAAIPLRFGIPVLLSDTPEYDPDAAEPGCYSSVYGYLSGVAPDGLQSLDGLVEWRQWGREYGDGWDCPDGDTKVTNPAWTLVVDESLPEVRIELPFASLTAKQAPFFASGRWVNLPYFFVDTLLRAPTGETVAMGVDSTIRGIGEDFQIGSDVPNDVPCTQECPA